MMNVIKVTDNSEAKAQNIANPSATVVNETNGDIWVGPATLRPIKGRGKSYFCFADHDFDAIGVVAMRDSGLWVAHRYGEVVAMRPTMRDAAIDLVQASRQ